MEVFEAFQAVSRAFSRVRPRLLVHPFFVHMLDKFEALMRKVCFKVPTTASLSRADVLFSAGEEGKSMPPGTEKAAFERETR